MPKLEWNMKACHWSRSRLRSCKGVGIFNELGHIRLVKIDVEGFEHEVIDELLPALGRSQIDYMDIELNRDLSGSSWPRLEGILRDLSQSLKSRFFYLSRDGDLIPRTMEHVLQGPKLDHLLMSFDLTNDDLPNPQSMP